MSSIHSKFILDFLLFSDGNNIVNIRLRALKLCVLTDQSLLVI